MALSRIVRSRATAKKSPKKVMPLPVRGAVTKAPTVNPVSSPKAVPRPVVSRPAAPKPQASPVPIKKAAPIVPVSSGSPSGGVAAPPMQDAATAYLSGQRKSADLVHQQNLKDMVDFQNWYTKQADTAEGFLKDQYAATTKATQDYAAQALAASQALSRVNNNNIVADSPEAQMVRDMGTSYLSDQAAGTGRAQQLAAAGAMLTSGQRSIDSARMKDMRNQELNIHNARLSDISKNELENIYKQQQLKIDAATAEALGAKNAAELGIAKYKAETDRQQVLSTQQYNQQRLLIDQQYKQGLLTSKDREIELQQLAALNGAAAKAADAKAKSSATRAASQKGARSLADKMLKEANEYYKTKFPKIGGWSTALPLSTRANYLGRVFTSIRNDYPDLKTLDIFNAMKAVYGANAVALIENKFAGGFN